MEKQVALLRAVNVGKDRAVPMKDLSALFTKLGAREVVTYIQSGNVVFVPSKGLTAAALSEAIEERFGFAVPVVVRTHAELRRALSTNPFLAKGADRKALHVAFLSAVPASSNELDPQRSPGDETALVGADLFLHLPNGVGKSKLTNAYLDRALGVIATVRNWNTVEKLAELSA